MRAHGCIGSEGTCGQVEAYSHEANSYDPEAPTRSMSFHVTALHEVRRLVSEQAEQAGIGEQRATDLVLALSEVPTNSVLHGGGGGDLAIWSEDGALCDLVQIRSGEAGTQVRLRMGVSG